MREAVIVAGVRTAVGKAPRGSLRTVRPDDMAAAVIEDLLRRVPELPPETIDDVIIGCATPEGESGTNVARVAAGGTESMSMLRGNTKFRPNPYLVEHRPGVYLSMGLTAENVARDYKVTREEADAFSYRSHQRALAAIEAGRLKDDGIVPLEVEVREAGGGQVKERRFTFDTDEGPRPDTTPEGLAKLKPVFHAKGAVTAG